jgi:putative membrane protein
MEEKKVVIRDGHFNTEDFSKPAPILLKYYFLVSLMSGPFFPLVFIPLYFKYKTLKYDLDASGISMSWGILFRKEVNLTFRRIQDIHLSRNIVQRWMKIATLDVQTASGSALPEMSIEGILDYEDLRDYLYSKMRGIESKVDESMNTDDSSDDEVLTLLTEIKGLLEKKLTKEQGNE